MTTVTPPNEFVGEKFDQDSLKAARDKALEIILEVSSQIRPGMVESDAKKILQEVQNRLGAPKSWHPAQIRFGQNTLRAFGEKGVENVPLKNDDIYFLDLGPIFNDHEGDVGRPFTIGNDAEMKKCCEDAKTIWHEVRDHWAQTQLTGEQLYRFAESCAQSRGWVLSLKEANGHRISDFPHAAKNTGWWSIEEFNQKPSANRWILEIQIRHPEKPFGAFYEDLLN